MGPTGRHECLVGRGGLHAMGQSLVFFGLAWTFIHRALLEASHHNDSTPEFHPATRIGLCAASMMRLF